MPIRNKALKTRKMYPSALAAVWLHKDGIMPMQSKRAHSRAPDIKTGLVSNPGAVLAYARKHN
jgi:hypothetical protein